MGSHEPIITSMLDDDLYKLTMCQAVCQCYPHAQAIYSFINRGGTEFTRDFVNHLRNEIDSMADLKLTSEEAAWLKQACPFLTPVFIDFFKGYRYDPSEVQIHLGPYSPENNLMLMIEGPWYRTIMWEVKLMAIISELYFRTIGAEYPQSEAEAIIIQKLANLSRGTSSYADFGTRRRFSKDHHDSVVRINSTNSHQFAGTSNMMLAMKYEVKPIGTQAHEWFMFHGAKYGYKEANRMALKRWVDVYHGDLGIALSDTFTTPVFFNAFNSEYAKLFDGVRHDSGNPENFARRVHAHYRDLGIDPLSKTIVFSDGLNPQKAIELDRLCKTLGIKCSFGIGTNLTNDIPGVTPLNMVIKMSHCQPYGEDSWIPAIKLSDTPGKHTGEETEIQLCKQSLRIS